MDLKECLNKGVIKKIKPNKELVRSLIEMSDIKEKLIKTSKITEENVPVFVSLAYDSLREILESICIYYVLVLLSKILLKILI